MVRTTAVRFTFRFAEFLLNLMNLGDLLGVGIKLKKIFSRTTTKWVPLLQPGHGFCQQNEPERGQVLVSKWKNSVSSRLFECCYVVIQGAWVFYRINKDKSDKSLPLLAFRKHVVNVIFLKYSKEVRLSSSHLGIRNISADVCYDDTKHYQMQSEHMRIQNPCKHLRRSAFA